MDQLEALLIREQHYQCDDYLSLGVVHEMPRSKGLESLPPPVLMSMLHECASLVTDTSSTRSAEAQRTSSGNDIRCTGGSDSKSNTHNAAPPKSPSSVAMYTEGERQKSTASRQGPLQSAQDFVFWRGQMCNWAFVVVNNFAIDKETVTVAFNMLDRYVVHEQSIPCAPTITREDYQLFAMTALYIAVKVLEPYPRKIAVDALVVMSRDFYSEADILHTELDMLQALQWKINAPTVLTFSRLYLDSLMEQGCHVEQEDKDEIERICSMLAQRVVVDSFFVPIKDSLIGLACLRCAMHVMGLPLEDKLRPWVKSAKKNSVFWVVMEKLLCKMRSDTALD